MNAYMLQDTKSGLFYKRRCGWVKQTEGSIWPNRCGPSAAKGQRALMRGCEPVTRTFTLEEADAE
jgi:hypothetical protein